MKHAILFLLLVSWSFSVAAEDCRLNLTCPERATVALDGDACSKLIARQDIGNIIAYSPCSSSNIRIQNPGPYGIGEHIVTVRATAGFQSSSCNINVTVVDNTAPVVNCNDHNLMINNLDIVNFDNLDLGSANDACGIEQEIINMDEFNGTYGTYEYNYFAVDASQNFATCSGQVTIRPNPFHNYCEYVLSNNPDRPRISALSLEGINNVGFSTYFVEDDIFRISVGPQTLRAYLGRDIEVRLTPDDMQEERFWEIYLDINQNNQFEPAAERVYVAFGRGQQEGSFSLPHNFNYRGNTKMRIITGLVSNQMRGPCPPVNFEGDIIDYNVELVYRLDYDLWWLRENASTNSIKATNIPSVDDEAMTNEVARSYKTTSSEDRIYPNPLASGQDLNIQLGDASPVKEISVSTITGREVQRQTLTDMDSGLFKLRLQTQTSGIYVVRAFDADGKPVWTKRLVHQ